MRKGGNWPTEGRRKLPTLRKGRFYSYEEIRELVRLRK